MKYHPTFERAGMAGLPLYSPRHEDLEVASVLFLCGVLLFTSRSFSPDIKLLCFYSVVLALALVLRVKTTLKYK